MTTIKIEVWGKRALFSRPEFRVEKVSYDVMTPAAARGILEAIYWHPGMRYIIKSIAVLNPIKFERIKSNGIKRKLPGKSMRKAAEGRAPVNDISPIYTSECPQQSTAMYLKDVHYVIEASIIMTDKANPSDNLTKFYKMLERRAQKGQCYHHPYLGTRECTADFRLWEKDTMPINPDMTNIDLGWMLHDMQYRNKVITPQFFRATIHNGIVDCDYQEVIA